MDIINQIWHTVTKAFFTRVCLYMPTSERENASEEHLCVWFIERNWWWVVSRGSTVDERPPRLNEVNRTDSIRRWISTPHITVHLACSRPCCSIKHSISASPFLILASGYTTGYIYGSGSNQSSVLCGLLEKKVRVNWSKPFTRRQNITRAASRCNR